MSKEEMTEKLHHLRSLMAMVKLESEAHSPQEPGRDDGSGARPVPLPISIPIPKNASIPAAYLEDVAYTKAERDRHHHHQDELVMARPYLQQHVQERILVEGPLSMMGMAMEMEMVICVSIVIGSRCIGSFKNHQLLHVPFSRAEKKIVKRFKHRCIVCI